MNQEEKDSLRNEIEKAFNYETEERREEIFENLMKESELHPGAEGYVKTINDITMEVGIAWGCKNNENAISRKTVYSTKNNSDTAWIYED